MKTKLLIMLLLLVAGVSWGQEKSDDPCKPQIVTAKTKDSRNEAEKYVKKYKRSDNISLQIKEEIEKEYTDLQKGYNKVYGDIKNDIASGFLFVGDNSLCKTKYYNELVKLDEKTQEFLNKRRIVTKSADKMANSGIIDVFITVVSIIEKVYNALEDAAENKADKFYKKLAWKNYDEL